MTNSPTTPKDTKQKIIEAASQLFSEKGFAGTTTREIAELAQVNEVTLFRHFGTKDNLAKSVVDQFGGPAIAEELESHLTGNYQQDLQMIGTIMMNVMTEKSNTMRMVICEAGSFPELQGVAAENPRQLRRMLARYFQRQMETGTIPTQHPEVLAQAFLGMFFSYVILDGFLSDSLEPKISKEDITKQFVELFLLGSQTQGTHDGQ